MPIIYKARQSTMANKEGKKLFHPAVVPTGTVDLEKLANEVAQLSSLSPGDVFNTCKNLVTVMTQHLQSSETVQIDGLGNFSFTMRSKGKGFETSDEVTANNSKAYVLFRPAMKRNLDGTVSTRSLITGCSFVRIDKSANGNASNAGSEGSGTSSGNTGSGGGSEGDDGEVNM